MFRPRRDVSLNLYELLEISPHASQDVIQAAYRVLARHYHPDVNASAEATLRIRQVNAAYRVLSDPQNRARYDLECTRARRSERLTQRTDRVTTTRLSGARRFRVALLRPQELAGHPAEERASALNGQAVLGLVVVVAMAAFLLVVLWATFDVPADYNPAYTGPTVQLSGR
jgi:hypothetical protein